MNARNKHGLYKESKIGYRYLTELVLNDLMQQTAEAYEKTGFRPCVQMTRSHVMMVLAVTLVFRHIGL